MIRPSTIAAAAALALCVHGAGACASASNYGDEPVGGLFDGESDEAYRGGAMPAGASPTAGYAPADAPMAAPAPVAQSEVINLADDAAGGALDFLGGAIEGAFVKNRKAMSRPAEPTPATSPPPPPPPPDKPTDPDAGTPKPVESSEGGKPAKRLVIYTGSVQVLVTNVVESADKLQAKVEAMGGFMLNRNGNTSSNNVTITVRMPAEHFYAVVKDLGSFGQVINEQLSASDVTKQMFDLELRLETAEKSRQRLLDLLKSAAKMEEILQIENQVRRLTDEIERMKGELRFLQDQVAFSTLTVSFFSNAPPPTPGPMRTRSRFEWINQVGIEQVLGGF